MNKEKKINLHLFGMIYFVLFFISVGLNEKEPFLKFPKLDDSFGKTMGIDLGISIGIGLFIVLITWLLTRYNRHFQGLSKNFQGLLGQLGFMEIFFISAFSSISEEFFFRGLIQAKFGIILASLLFGMLHSGPGKKYLPWTFFALAMGFVLGGLYEWRDNLILPVMVHFIVNFINLMLLQKYRSQDTAS